MSRRILALCVLLFLAGCAGSTPAPEPARPVRAESPEDLLKQAETDVAARRFQMAQQRLARLGKPAADQSRAQLAAAEVLLGLGHPKEALKTFEPLQSDAALGQQARQGMGLSLLALDDAGAAQAQLEQAVAQDPTLWRAWTALGRAYDRAHRWRDAETAYGKALDQAPEPALVINNMGMSRMLQHDYPGAAALFEKALAADPALKTARSNLRLALAWQGRYDEALLSTEPAERSDALNNVGYVAMLRGDYQAAQKYLAQAIAGSPTFHVAATRNLEMLKLVAKSQGKVAKP